MLRYYGSIAVAAALGDLTDGSVRVAELDLGGSEVSVAYATYSSETLKRITLINMEQYNGTSENGLPSQAVRPVTTYVLNLPASCVGVPKIRRLLADGSDAISGISFDGFSFNWELDNGKPVLLKNVTSGEEANIRGYGEVAVDVPWSSAAIVDVDC